MTSFIIMLDKTNCTHKMLASLTLWKIFMEPNTWIFFPTFYANMNWQSTYPKTLSFVHFSFEILKLWWMWSYHRAYQRPVHHHHYCLIPSKQGCLLRSYLLRVQLILWFGMFLAAIAIPTQPSSLGSLGVGTGTCWRTPHKADEKWNKSSKKRRKSNWGSLVWLAFRETRGEGIGGRRRGRGRGWGSLKKGPSSRYPKWMDCDLHDRPQKKGNIVNPFNMLTNLWTSHFATLN